VVSFPCSSDTYRVLVGPYHGGGAPKRRALARASSRMETVTTWNEDEATRIAEAAEGWMRAHQPPGYTPTPEESQRMSILHSRLQEAGRMRDMGAWRKIHMSLLCLAMASYRRFAG
jgi:hypothetical protein